MVPPVYTIIEVEFLLNLYGSKFGIVFPELRNSS